MNFTDMTPIPDYPGYYASPEGFIISTKYREPRQLKSHRAKGGYRNISMTRSDGVSKVRNVHRVIAETFHGPCPSGLQVRHLDGDKDNNASTNLKYGSARENRDDSDRHGTSPLGERHGMRKLTESQVYRVRAAFDSGRYSLRDMEEMFGIGSRQITRIGLREGWSSLPERKRDTRASLADVLHGMIRPAMSGAECRSAVERLVSEFEITPRLIDTENELAKERAK